ncbi:MAG: OsmC family peroxiredoxin [Spirochaetaceae bacterium]|nr:MAG: OsmC family peroxiredoxin [Spirochaetaceae bacterium]
MGWITRAEYADGMSFDVELQGHRFTIDADEQFGGQNKGPRPKALLLSGLAGCTAMDVVSILTKMKMPYDSFAVEVDADMTDEHPKVYSDIRVRYVFTGADLDRSKIEKAVKLSEERYCGASAMLGKSARITSEIVTNAS